jgi:hypothetical protein
VVDRPAVTASALLDRFTRDRALPRNLRAQLAAWLASPWACDETDARAVSARRMLQIDAPIATVGHALLVAYRHGRGALFVLCDDGPYTFGKTASVVAAEALRLAKRCAPTLAYPELRARERWRAEYLYSAEARHDLLDGASFGLALVLAEASRCCGHVVPTHLCATAVVDERGVLRAVDGLRAKLSVIAEGALAVTDVLVAKTQQNEAVQICATLDRPLNVRAFVTAEEAVTYAFSRCADEPPRGWSAADERERALDALIRCAMEGEPMADWTRVARPLQWLERWMPSNPRAQLALAIAQRHAGEASIAIEWNDRLVDDLGLTYVAQVVQAAADAGDEQTSRYVERALALADLLPAEPGSLRARGAAARALGCMRRYEQAARECEHSVQRWARRNEREQASRPLCEWMRVASILGDRAGFERAAALRSWFASSDPSSAYIALERCAGRVRLGDLREAIELAEQAIDAARTTNAQRYVGASLARWHARALAASGQRERAQRVRDELAEREADGIEARWCALDRALEDGDEAAIERTFDAVIERRPQGTRWITSAASILERARALADEAPY